MKFIYIQILLMISIILLITASLIFIHINSNHGEYNNYLSGSKELCVNDYYILNETDFNNFITTFGNFNLNSLPTKSYTERTVCNNQNNEIVFVTK